MNSYEGNLHSESDGVKRNESIARRARAVCPGPSRLSAEGVSRAMPRIVTSHVSAAHGTSPSSRHLCGHAGEDVSRSLKGGC